MRMPTREQINRGQIVASEMFDATVEKTLNGVVDYNNFRFPEIVELYVRREIDSVTGIYLAMSAV